MIYSDPNSITFSPEDRPEDFVQIEPLNKAKELPKLSMTAKATLPAFEGASILYGFKFSSPKEEEFSLRARERKSEIDAKLKELQESLKSANSRGTGMSKKVRDVIDELYSMLSDRVTNPRFMEMMTVRTNMELEKLGLLQMTKAGKLQKLGEKRIAQYLKSRRDNNSNGSAPAIRKKIKELQAEMTAMEEKISVRGKFMNSVQRAFLNKLKHPKSPEDKSLQEEFVQNAVANYTRLRPNFPYEYIVYPESSGELNQAIAVSLAKHYGATPIRGLDKIPNPTIDTTSFSRQHGDKDKEWIRNTLFQNKDSLSNAIDRNTGQIKNITGKNTNFRPYIRNWQISQDLGQNVNPEHKLSGFRNRRLLLIDDNTASGGTLQANYKVLIEKQKPKSIHIYTPIWVNFSY